MATSALLDFTDTTDLVSPVAIFRAVWAPDYSCFDPQQTICLQSFKPFADTLNAAGFETAATAPENCGTAIVQITRSKQESLGLLALAYQSLAVGGLLIVYGSKTDGIESILKQIKAHLPTAQVTSKNHGKFITLIKDTQPVEPLNSWLAHLDPIKQDHGFITANGIFSPAKIDKGSQLLAPFCANLTGSCADFGAGWGWLSHTALDTSPDITDIHLIEAENVALDCARQNIQDARAHFHWRDILHDPIPGPFDTIVMNPPFHQSRKAEPDLGMGFITQSAQNLKPKGQLLMVANRQLAYEATLDDQFAQVDLLDQTPNFKLIRARRPKSNKSSPRRR